MGMLILLVENSAQVNTEDNNGVTPLHLAALEGNDNAVTYLETVANLL